MNDKEKFIEIMEKGETIALASSVNNIPNVRILNFVYLKNENIMYFTSFKGDKKEKEFLSNKNAAFTTLPKNESSCVRVNFANVKKSIKTIDDVKDLFIKKWNWYKEFIEKNCEKMDVYEVHFSTAVVFPDPDNGYNIEL